MRIWIYLKFVEQNIPSTPRYVHLIKSTARQSQAHILFTFDFLLLSLSLVKARCIGIHKWLAFYFENDDGRLGVGTSFSLIQNTKRIRNEKHTISTHTHKIINDEWRTTLRKIHKKIKKIQKNERIRSDTNERQSENGENQMQTENLSKMKRELFCFFYSRLHSSAFFWGSRTQCDSTWT